jgi:hypothetical protein
MFGSGRAALILATRGRAVCTALYASRQHDVVHGRKLTTMQLARYSRIPRRTPQAVLVAVMDDSACAMKSEWDSSVMRIMLCREKALTPQYRVTSVNCFCC